MTGKEYDEAERILFRDGSQTDSNGKRVTKVLPFCLVKLEGKDYFETLGEIVADTDTQIVSSVIPGRFTDFQSVDEGQVAGYSPEILFEKNRGI